MIRFLQVGGWVAASLLLVAVFVGFAATAGLSAPLAHVPIGLCATLAVLLHQSLFLFYYVGISTSLTGVLRRERLPEALGAGVPGVRRIVPLSVAALVAVTAAFTLGGGAHTGDISPHLHGGIAVLALVTALVAAWVGGRALAEVGSAIGMIEGQLGGR